MAITLFPTVTPAASPARTSAEALGHGARNLAAQVEATRSRSANALWRPHDSTPAEVLAELSPESRAKLMSGDIAARILLALRQSDPLAAFVASSPVPSTHTVALLDAAGSPVDVSGEVAALLSKLATVADAAALPVAP